MSAGRVPHAERFHELDLLRGVAALWVVAFHYLREYHVLYGDPNAGFPHFPDGIGGVKLFFLISGFVIFMTLERSATGREFVVSRVSRLYPAYWTAVLITFTVGYLWPLPDQTGYSLSQLAVNLSMLQAYFYVPAVDGAYWSLAVELSFYVVMLALFELGLLKHIRIVSFIWIALDVTIMLFRQHHIDIVPYRLGMLLSVPYANLFVAGIAFYDVRRRGWNRGAVLILAASLAAQAAIAGVGDAGVVALFFLAFALALSGRLTVFCRSPLLWLGTISYSLYLTHQMLGYRVIMSLKSLGVSHLTASAIATVGALALASLITLLVERPAQRALRRLLLKRRPKAVEAAQPAVEKIRS